MGEKTRLFIVASKPRVVELEEILIKDDKFCVCGASEFENDFLAEISKSTPDVAIIDTPPDYEEINKLIARTREEFPKPILAITRDKGNPLDNYKSALYSICGGAEGYIMEEWQPGAFCDRLREAIYEISSGRSYPNDQGLLKRVGGLDEFMKNLKTLTIKECDVFLLAAIKLLSNEEISNELHEKLRTIEYRIGRTYKKLGVADRNELVKYATLAVYCIIDKYNNDLVKRVDGLDEFMKNLKTLTPTENIVFLRAAIELLSNKEISTTSHRSRRTIEEHLRHICEKLDVDNKYGLIKYGTLAVYCIIGKYNNNHTKPYLNR